MIEKYCLPELPSHYWVVTEHHKCNMCGTIFYRLLSGSESIIQLETEDGSEVRWLPVFGRGGYLALLKHATGSDISDNENAREKAARIFEKNYIEKYLEPINGKPLLVKKYPKIVCPVCNSDSFIEEKETVEKNPTIQWARVICSQVEESSRRIVHNTGTIQDASTASLVRLHRKREKRVKDLQCLFHSILLMLAENPCFSGESVASRTVIIE